MAKTQNTQATAADVAEPVDPNAATPQRSPEPPRELAKAKAADLYAYPIPDVFTGKPGIEMLMEACTLYNINPDQNLKPGDPKRPRQLLSWKYFGDNEGRPELPDERIVLVTGGGVKLSYPADQDTVERLQRVFRLIRKRKGPNNEEIAEVLPMPDDLALPTSALTGIVETADHRYESGYLRAGGSVEGARRQAIRAKAGLA